MKHTIITVYPFSKESECNVKLLSMYHVMDCEKFLMKLILEEKDLSTFLSSVPVWGKPQAVIQKNFMVLVSDFELKEFQKE